MFVMHVLSSSIIIAKFLFYIFKLSVPDCQDFSLGLCHTLTPILGLFPNGFLVHVH